MSNEVRLRDIEPNDLPIFYEQQLDADATRMAAFPARDRAAFDAHWATNILGNPAAVNQTILLRKQVTAQINDHRFWFAYYRERFLMMDLFPQNRDRFQQSFDDCVQGAA